MVCSIVVTYNGSEWIYRCVNSLLQSGIDDHHVFIIDNGSNDNTIEIVRKNFPSVEIQSTGKNNGFGKANNIGLRKAYNNGADYCFLLNQDAWVESNVIEKLVSIHKSNRNYGLLSPIHLNGSGDSWDYGFERYLKRMYSTDYVDQIRELPKNDNRLYPVNAVNAAFWLLSRDVLEAVGGFNPLFFHYGEDIEYVNRCLFHGFKIGILSGCFGYHDRLQYDNKKKTQQELHRRIEIDLLNPGKEINARKHMVLIFKQIVKDSLSMDFSKIWNLLKWYYQFRENRGLYLQNRESVSKRGLTFL